MISNLVNKIISDVCYIGVTTIIGVTSFYVKKYLNTKKDFLRKQEAALKEKIGIEQYKNDTTAAKDIVLCVEQLARENDWKGELKHCKAIELIKNKTSLTDSDIDIIIKSVVGELNKDKPKTV